jgi:AcrR family transcriptional regulator
VAMDEIGAEAGIVGSGVYRHFASKNDLLVALLDQAMQRLQNRATTIVAQTDDDHVALSLLVRDHIRVALHDRDILAVYHREAHSLPDADRRRLRREQRHYIEEWVAAARPRRRRAAAARARRHRRGAGDAVLPQRADRAAARRAARRDRPRLPGRAPELGAGCEPDLTRACSYHTTRPRSAIDVSRLFRPGGTPVPAADPALRPRIDRSAPDPPCPATR